jgi:hypothetical protein
MRLVLNIGSHNRAKIVNNDLTNVPCKRWWSLANHPHNNLLIIAKNYNMPKQECLLECNNFASKLAKNQTK